MAFMLLISRWVHEDGDGATAEETEGYSLWDFLPDESPTTWDTIDEAEAAALVALQNPDAYGIAPECVVVEV